ncbi:MAG: hypothetical protein VBE63_09360 [Lamprobacter sp.]|uniref:hypothetical protein n=1 Tax=Lamprobacter sp. TaxID=3100796 RepID=UPI002B25E714|nr:hypothetical protein [Lamprobacter sp.]MEA3640137.1 hypothetical protein [Lamprobacter sp.]
MQQALTLTEQERLYFMQALNAVAYHNKNPARIWLELLRQCRELLNVAKADYQFQAGVPGIVEKVNKIKSPRARLYFLRLIHDAHLREVEDIFWNGDKMASLTSFKRIYSQLAEATQLY